jgi:hypothetical protein
VVFLFRDKSIINLFYLVVLSVIVHIHLLTGAPVVITHSSDGLFSLALQRYVSGLSSTPLFLLYHTILLFQAMRLNMVLNDMRMFHNNTYTTAMSVVLLSGIMTDWCAISPALLANFLLIWIFIKLSRLYNHPSPKTLLFNTGLVVGATMLCYHPTAVLIPVVLFALAVVRPFRLSEWMILLMGTLLPYYFLAGWLFLNDHLSTFPYFLPYLRLNFPATAWTVPMIVQLSLLFIVFITGIYFWQVSSNRMVIQTRKNWGVMMVMQLILLPVPFLFRDAGIAAAAMYLVPLAAFTGNSFSYPRSLLVPNLIFWLAAGILVYNNWWLIKN